jgi:hypothetical protein
MPLTEVQKQDRAIASARTRRARTAGRRIANIEWFIKEVSDNISLSMRNRVGIATQLLKDRVVRNISVPVTKGTGPRGGRVITNRSRPGEFPRADTIQLMRTIFTDMKEVRSGTYDGYVGTPLDYGLILETKMDRKYLVRTWIETLPAIHRILTGPIT